MSSAESTKLARLLYDMVAEFQEAIARTQLSSLLSHHQTSDIAEHTGWDLYVNLCALDKRHFAQPDFQSNPQNHISTDRLWNEGFTPDALERECPEREYPEFESAFLALSRWTRPGRRPRFDLGRQALYLGVVSVIASLETLLEDLEEALPDPSVIG